MQNEQEKYLKSYLAKKALRERIIKKSGLFHYLSRTDIIAKIIDYARDSEECRSIKSLEELPEDIRLKICEICHYDENKDTPFDVEKEKETWARSDVSPWYREEKYYNVFHALCRYHLLPAPKMATYYS